ncbi:MAG: hypothetical protein UT44_C0047G0008 [Candidatus Levybacteria bacterium GW2011_GWA1_39_32]|nr:MAG: hypothetical protein UT44_C0047G0008 [Candidatus Levybacteria bacterium GW2011_GWA1_39_32]
MADISSSLILLTYKGKILLMHKKSGAMDEEAHPWCFIGGIRKNKESYEAAMSRKVEEETGNIQRGEFQLLDFFTLKDLQKLSLAASTREFVLNHAHLIEKLPI